MEFNAQSTQRRADAVDDLDLLLLGSDDSRSRSSREDEGDQLSQILFGDDDNEDDEDESCDKKENENEIESEKEERQTTHRPFLLHPAHIHTDRAPPSPHSPQTYNTHSAILSFNDEDDERRAGDADDSSLLSMDEQLYHQLEEATHQLDSLHASNAATKRFSLSPSTSLFVDVESGGSDIRADFSLSQDLQNNEVLTLRVFCLPPFLLDDDFTANIQRLRVAGVDFLPLSFRLLYVGVSEDNFADHSPLTPQIPLPFVQQQAVTPSSVNVEKKNENNSLSSSSSSSTESGEWLVLQPSLFNGEYSLSLTHHAGHTLRAGRYSLYVNTEESREDPLYARHDDSHSQSIQISYAVRRAVSATSLCDHSVVRDSLRSHSDVRHFRFMLTDTSRCVRFAVRPIARESERETEKERERDFAVDLDLLITNRYNSLVAPQSDCVVWRSCENGCVEILPTDVQLSSAPYYIQRTHSAQSEGDGRSDDESESERTLPHDAHIQMFVLSVSASARLSENATEEEDSEDCESALCAFEVEVSTQSVLPSVQTIECGDCEEESLCVVQPLEDVCVGEMSYCAIEVRPEVPSHLLIVTQLPPVADTRPLNSTSQDMQSVLTRLSVNAHSAARVRGSVVWPLDVSGMSAVVERCQLHMIEKCLSEDRTTVSNNMPCVCDECVSQKFLFTVLYAAHNTMHPGPLDYQYRATGGCEAALYLNANDLKYVSNALYFSVCVCEVDAPFLIHTLHTYNAAQGAESENDMIDFIARTRCVSKTTTHSHNAPTQPLNGALCHVWRMCEGDGRGVCDNALYDAHRAALYARVSAHIDACRLTFRDREAVDLASAWPFNPICPAYHRLGSALSQFALTQSMSMSRFEESNEPFSLDDHSLTYSEVEFSSFVYMLHSLPARNGEVFVDLGSGAGHALFAAALSGVCFLKVLGLEALPSLCACSVDVMQSLVTQSQSRTQRGVASPNVSHAHNLSTQHHTPSRTNTHKPHIAPTQEDNLIAWLQQDANNVSQPAYAQEDDEMSLQSFLTQTSVSYRLPNMPDLSERLSSARVRLPIMEARNEDFTQSDAWLEADIVFASSLCFSEALLSTITHKASRLRSGARLVMASLPPENAFSKWFRHDKSIPLSLSCGDVLFHVLVRK